MSKESAHAQKLAFAVQHQIALFFFQIDPRHIQRNARRLGVAFQIRKQRTILRLRPRLNRSLSQSLQLVRNDQVEIEIDRVPKPLAPRARPIRIVEGKKPRLRLLVPQTALLALKPLREAERGTILRKTVTPVCRR